MHRRDQNEYLKQLMRDNTQLLINELWKVKMVIIIYIIIIIPALYILQLPVQRVNDAVLVEVR